MAGKKRTKAEIQELKEKIAAGLAQAYSYKQICRTLKLPVRTFYNYVDEIAEEMRKQHISKTNRIIYAYVHRSMQRVRELQQQYQNKKDPKLLKDAQAIEDSVNKFYQDLGILQRAPAEIKQDITLVTYKKPEWLEGSKKKKRGEDGKGT